VGTVWRSQLTQLVNGCTLSHDNTISGIFSLEGTAIKGSALSAMLKKAVGVQAIRRVVVVAATNFSTSSAGWWFVFAVNSLIGDFFALTASFAMYLLRSISSETMKATRKVVYAGPRSFIAESVVVDGDCKEIARGSGNFVISKIKLTADMGYCV
jgi:hypothetical protein